MEQTLVAPVSQAGFKFSDFLGYGVIRAIDSEFANPPAPSPQSDTSADRQVIQGKNGPTFAGRLGIDRVPGVAWAGIGALLVIGVTVWGIRK